MSQSRTASSKADRDIDNSMGKMKLSEKKDENLVTVAPCQPPAIREGKQTVTTFSNIYKLFVKPKTTVWRYDVMINAQTNTGHIIKLSAGPRDDASRIHRKEVCQAILKAGLDTILHKSEAYVFDGSRNLFTTGDLYDRITAFSNNIHLKDSQLSPDVIKFVDIVNLQNVSIEIFIPTKGPSSFDLAQFHEARQTGDLSNLDRTPLQCLELLTTSPAITSSQFTVIGDRLFPKTTPGTNRGRGQEERLGLVKGVRVLESAEGQPMAVMTVESKAGLFFKAQPLIQTVRELMQWRPEDDHCSFDFQSDDWNKVNDYVSGLRVTISYGTAKYNFIADGISTFPLKDAMIDCVESGERISVIAKYENVLPHWPAVVMKKRIPNRPDKMKEIKFHFPIDLLQIAPNQSVPSVKQSDQKPMPMHIEKRFASISSMLKGIYGGAHARILGAFGVTLSETPLSAEAIRRNLPGVLYRNDQNANGLNASWKMNRNLRVVAAARLDDVVVAYDARSQRDVESVKQMKEKLSFLAKQQGINANWHLLSTDQRSTYDKLVNVFDKVKEGKRKRELGPLVLLMYVDTIFNKESHNILKFFERKYETVTQHITMEVAQTVPSKPDTTLNILSKINEKMGGLNYRVLPDKFSNDSWISNGKSLVISYDVSHPTGSSGEVLSNRKPPTLPSIIGMAFNGSEHPENFIGDFVYQEPRKEQVTSSILTDRMQWMLNLFFKNRKQLPENIFILRDGVSDGQFKMVVDEEFEAIKEGIEVYKNKNKVKNWIPRYVLAIVTKRHNNRFAVLNDRDLPVNHLPGTVVDKELVRKDITHFYMLSHTVMKGRTGKLPSYYVPINELKYSDTETQDRLQSFFLGLSFLHQISQNSVSLPEPVYQADEWAKRGKNLWTVFCSINQNLPRLTKWNQKLYASAPLDFDEISRKLSYRGTALETFRTNA